MKRKEFRESRQFNMSVEGSNCEKLYFEHLARLINHSGRNQYNLKISPITASPLQYAKRNAHKPSERLPYIHIQDIEDYHDVEQRKKFFHVIDSMREAERTFGISYRLGYSNYTFELWMLLHVADMNFSVSGRGAYLGTINQYFHREYLSLADFKKTAEFQQILNEFVTLDTVFDAVRRAERIVEENAAQNKARTTYGKVTFYQDNPDVSVHKVVRLIFETCKVK